MEIPVLGMDPSLRNWGLASGMLCLEQGLLSNVQLKLIEPVDLKDKQVRRNSSDLHLAAQLAQFTLPYIQQAKVIFVEIPVGSQSARAMASYGICVGVLGAIRASAIPLIEVTALEVKLALAGNKNATKRQMIDAAYSFYPEANFPMTKGKIQDKAEHMADAIGAIHAGVLTPMFQQFMRILEKV
jgi:Holliday junction resolvasome RuvABC endonuclease subunit